MREREREREEEGGEERGRERERERGGGRKRGREIEGERKSYISLVCREREKNTHHYTRRYIVDLSNPLSRFQTFGDG